MREWKEFNVFKNLVFAPLLCLLVACFVPDDHSKQQGEGKRADASTHIDELLRSDSSAIIREVIGNVSNYKVQIIYTQIDRDKNNNPTFTNYTYRLNPKEYFYPASMVKLPVSALALEKLHRLHKAGLDRNSRMITGKGYKCQTAVKRDFTSANKYPSIGNYIKKALIISDNDAYNRLYEFLGPGYIHNRLSEMVYPDIRIIQRFAPCDTLANRYTNPIDFYNNKGRLVYRQPMKFYADQLSNPNGPVSVGSGFFNGRDIIEGARDFTFMNYMNLQDIHNILISLIFPQAVDEKKRFDIPKNDLHFLQKYMGMYPYESIFPKYNRKLYFDSYCNYLYYGNEKQKITNKNLRIFNIVGQSYGFLSDCAYFADFNSKTEFFLSAVIYTNKNEILNDGKYEYETIGFPFLARLGKIIYAHEHKRKKEHKPNLSEFMFYGKK